jgi:MoxR-like ATPase
MSNTRPNPYPGPRPFQRDQTLYGRDQELRDLRDLLIGERIVLLYSPSGAGKTSLIQAALIPELEREHFRVLPLMRATCSARSRRWRRACQSRGSWRTHTWPISSSVTT